MAGSPQIRIVPEGDVLVEQGDPGQAVFLLLDGILVVERDGQAIAEVGPGAVLGEQALFAEGRRTSTLRAATRCRVAVRAANTVDPGALSEVAHGRGVETTDIEWPPPSLAERTGGFVSAPAARTFAEFYEAYLRLHARPVTRWAHTLGWFSATGLVVAALVQRRPSRLARAVVAFVLPPVLSHTLVEHNAPATGRPLWELRADVRMIASLLSRRAARRWVWPGAIG